MNLNRSRTERWRECLKQIRDRRGTLEVSVDVAEDSERVPTNLVWRVHLLGFDGERIVVEQPMALGQTMRIEPGVRLVVAMANRRLQPARRPGVGARGSGHRDRAGDRQPAAL